jgi:hypothetical protein
MSESVSTPTTPPHPLCPPPQDVLVTRTKDGNRFHIIEINGTGIAGMTNMANGAVNTVLRSLGACVEALPQHNATIIVASSSTDADPPTSSTLYEKVGACQHADSTCCTVHGHCQHAPASSTWCMPACPLYPLAQLA